MSGSPVPVSPSGSYQCPRSLPESQTPHTFRVMGGGDSKEKFRYRLRQELMKCPHPDAGDSEQTREYWWGSIWSPEDDQVCLLCLKCRKKSKLPLQIAVMVQVSPEHVAVRV